MAEMQAAAKSQQENFADLLEALIVAVTRETCQKLGLFTGDVDALQKAVAEEKERILKALTQS